MSFKDHFSRSAAAYATYRPTYPPELFAYLGSLVARHEIAWDCATGNGQAACSLKEHFARVIATDASTEQLARAIGGSGVEYGVARAEASGLRDASIDLVTVAQALHWFDIDAFYAEAQRVMVPGGVLAVWSYGDSYLEESALDGVLQRFNRETVGAFWLPERDLVNDGYRGLPFPFGEFAVPSFVLEQSWTLAELAGYVRTWSASTRYAAHHGVDPVVTLEAELRGAWGDPRVARTVRWPLALRAGSKPRT